MDYLSRSLNKIGETEGFHFHPRCKSMRLNHLVFADDLIIFCKGERKSIDLVLEGLENFTAVSGLAASPAKSSMYFCNVDPVSKQEILQHSGFTEGTLPFRYLGMNVSSKKLSVNDCECLIEKIVRKNMGDKIYELLCQSSACKLSLAFYAYLLGFNFHYPKKSLGWSCGYLQKLSMDW